MDEILAERRVKLERLEEAGLSAYPATFANQDDLSEVLSRGQALAPEETNPETFRLAGRLVARRGHGRIIFLDLKRDENTIQLLLRQGETDNYDLAETIDIGDFLGVSGQLTRTKRGEITLLVESWEMLAKALRPLPDKFHGLKDGEIRSRQRELDLLANEESFRVFQTRSRVISYLRRYLEERRFLEVETPVLQPIYGGALARPFRTHHNSLDQEMYLRIASELYLKRCLVGGIDRVFEIGKNFRNEGLSVKHNPEFTMLEYYEAYADYREMAQGFAEMISSLTRDVLGQSEITIDGTTIDLASPWRRVSFVEAVEEKTGINLLASDAENEMRAYLGQDDLSWGEMADKIFSREVEPTLIEPTFVLDYPVEMSPFAKRCPENAALVERWEAFLGGREIANAFSELNDPREQKERFLAQAKSEEAQPYDEGFLRALEHGMPPTGGVGLGIDRLVALLTGRDNIREVILFPAMREET